MTPPQNRFDIGMKGFKKSFDGQNDDFMRLRQENTLIADLFAKREAQIKLSNKFLNFSNKVSSPSQFAN